MKNIVFNGKKIFFTDNGKGETLVLLHGFAESMDIWTRFAEDLAKDTRVISIDLPGHGLSEILGPVHTMEMMADVVMEVLKSLKITKCSLFGHSMGGYVALAFAAKYPVLLKNLGLIHSHPYPDNKDQKIQRDRAIRIAELNKFDFLADFIPELFAEKNRSKFAKEIKSLVRKSSEMSKDGIVAALKGMKERIDQSDTLKKAEFPVMIIVGMKDIKFPHNRLNEIVNLSKETIVVFLRETGHMGYIEEDGAILRALRGFVRSMQA